MGWRVGIDSGGTFTDVCLFDEVTGVMRVWKVPSTPDDPSSGVVEGLLEGVALVGAAASDVSYFGHGTTVGTNALLQHRGVKTGLITTAGFRDLLEIGRQKRPHLYDIQVDKPEVLVARDLRFGVPERMRFDGRTEVPLDEAAVRDAVRKLREQDVKAIAICFLYGYAFTAHETRAMEIVKDEFPEAFASASHEIAPEFREFERMSTTVVNAYLGPVMAGYIARLANRLIEIGTTAPPHITQSNGGVISFSTAGQQPVRTLLSGPSTGVVAAQAIGKQIGQSNLITFDMGGTSSDVALLKDGHVATSSEAEVEGYPIKVPAFDIHTVGAGGGSIAYIDGGGLLKVGPRSAGAHPGPVCYGYGNTEPTVTDANVVLQTLNPTALLAGRMPIDQQLPRAAIEDLASRIGMGLYETAEGVLSVVVANMAKAIRVISVQRGHDPRDFALLAFGGAGPLHAARLAQELGIGRVIVPTTPGILCATGLLLTDLRADFAETRLLDLDPARIDDLRASLLRLEERAEQWFDEEGVGMPVRRKVRTVDMRYKGQNYELAVPLAEGELTESSLFALEAAFLDAHRQRFGFVAEGEVVQIVTIRVESIGVVSGAKFSAATPAGEDASSAIAARRQVWMSEAGGMVECPVYERTSLKAGNRILGPAIIEQMDTTTVVPVGAVVTVEPYLNLVMDLRK